MVQENRAYGLAWNTLWGLYWFIFCVTAARAIVMNQYSFTSRKYKKKYDKYTCDFMSYIWERINGFRKKVWSIYTFVGEYMCSVSFVPCFIRKGHMQSPLSVVSLWSVTGL